MLQLGDTNHLSHEVISEVHPVGQLARDGESGQHDVDGFGGSFPPASHNSDGIGHPDRGDADDSNDDAEPSHSCHPATFTKYSMVNSLIEASVSTGRSLSLTVVVVTAPWRVTWLSRMVCTW